MAFTATGVPAVFPLLEGVGPLLSLPRLHPWLYRKPVEGGPSAVPPRSTRA